MKRLQVMFAVLALAGLMWRAPAGAADTPSAKTRILLVTGVDYPGHHWRETAPVLAKAVSADARLEVITVEDPHFLDSAALDRYATVIIHFQNWEQPGPGPQARDNLKRFVARGGGLALVHFGCGAWYGEWPEFEKLAGRVWAGSGVRQHDPFGTFQVEFTNEEPGITAGIKEFETKDELYTCLTGTHPIRVLAQARSKVDGKMYPMAFASQFEKGKTFHCVLGHDAQALSVPGVQELFRRGIAWTSGLVPVAK